MELCIINLPYYINYGCILKNTILLKQNKQTKLTLITDYIKK
jgi:hypothetical protein